MGTFEVKDLDKLDSFGLEVDRDCCGEQEVDVSVDMEAGSHNSYRKDAWVDTSEVLNSCEVVDTCTLES